MVDPARRKPFLTNVDQHARLEAGARFVARLHELSRRSQHSWRRADSVGRDIGLAGADLEQAVTDAEQAGLIERRADDPGLIILTDARRMAAARPR